MIDYGEKIISRREDGTYVIDGYHVCPKSIDPCGRYDIHEVESYLAEHPEALVPEPVPPPPTQEELDRAEEADLLAYLASTDWYAIRYAETGQGIPADVEARRADARARISELRGRA